MSSRILKIAREAIDKQNLRKINQAKLGSIVVLDYITENGLLKAYETVVTANERSEMLRKQPAIRLNDATLIDLNSDSDDDGFVSD